MKRYIGFMVLAVLVCTASVAMGDVYFVKSDGITTGLGPTYATALTIDKALGLNPPEHTAGQPGYKPGDVIVLAPGTYNLNAIILLWSGEYASGTASAPIRIIGDYSAAWCNHIGAAGGISAGPVILDGSLLAGEIRGVFKLNNLSYWEINGVVIRNAPMASGIYFTEGQGAHHWTIKDSVIYNNGSTRGGAIFFDCEGATEINDVLIENCLIYGNGTAGILVKKETGATGINHRITVRNCTVSDNLDRGIYSTNASVQGLVMYNNIVTGHIQQIHPHESDTGLICKFNAANDVIPFQYAGSGANFFSVTTDVSTGAIFGNMVYQYTAGSNVVVPGGMDIWLDSTVNQVFDAGETQITGNEDGVWRPVNDTQGSNWKLVVDNTDLNNAWETGSDIWLDGDNNGLYNAGEPKVYDGGDGWTAPNLAPGTANLVACDIEQSAYYLQKDMYASYASNGGAFRVAVNGGSDTARKLGYSTRSSYGPTGALDGAANPADDFTGTQTLDTKVGLPVYTNEAIVNLGYHWWVATADADADGMLDSWETTQSPVLNPANPTDAALDPDLDGYTNLQEYQNNTNPNVLEIPDTDGDGLDDRWEMHYFVNLTTATAISNSDGDGLTDKVEHDRAVNSGDHKPFNPGPTISAVDDTGTDLDPTNPDTDGDGLKDGAENATWVTGKTYTVTPGSFVSYTNAKTNPLLEDSDADQLPDGWEAGRKKDGSSAGFTGYGIDGIAAPPNINPWLDPTDSSGANGPAGDPDGDVTAGGYNTNLSEYQMGTDPTDHSSGFKDLDNDGIDDSWEASFGADLGDNGTGGGLPGTVDTDSDGLTDFQEWKIHSTGGDAVTGAVAIDPTNPDSDGDGLQDGYETAIWTTAWALGIFNNITDTGTVPVLADSDGDGMNDGWEVTYNDVFGGSGFSPVTDDTGNGSYDPDANPDNDPYTNLQENQHNFNPNAGNFPKAKSGSGGGGCLPVDGGLSFLALTLAGAWFLRRRA
ncbi:MAG: right-handed parallel beta-helix repeat-containing protein [Planctomycetota bacterium]